MLVTSVCLADVRLIVGRFIFYVYIPLVICVCLA